MISIYVGISIKREVINVPEMNFMASLSVVKIFFLFFSLLVVVINIFFCEWMTWKSCEIDLIIFCSVFMCEDIGDKRLEVQSVGIIDINDISMLQTQSANQLN